MSESNPTDRFASWCEAVTSPVEYVVRDARTNHVVYGPTSHVEALAFVRDESLYRPVYAQARS